MNIELSFEQREVRDVARRMGRDVLDARARQAEREGRVPVSTWKTIADLGLLQSIPEDLGGAGHPDPLTLLVGIEALAEGDPATTAAAVFSANAANLISALGTQAQRDEYLPQLAADPEARAGLAIYEGFGRAPSEYQTRIDIAASGEVRVTGKKLAVANGRLASPLVVVGRDKEGSLRAAILPRDAPGVRVDRQGYIIGLAAAPSEDLTIEHVGSEAILLGGRSAGPDALSRAVSQLRLSVAALAIGCAERAIEYASKYAAERIVFGRPVASFQGPAFLLAESAIQVLASRTEFWRLCSRLADLDVAELEHLVSHAVSYAGATANRATRDAVQVLGGHGYLTDHPIERLYRAAAGLSALDFDPGCSSYAAAL